MCVEWKSIILIMAVIFVALLIIKFIEKKTNINAEIKRKMFHVTMGLVMLIFPYIFTSVVSVGILGSIAIAFLYILKHTKLKDSLGTILFSVDRESMGEIFFAISVFLIFYLSKGDKILFSIPILILTFADSTAALIGKNYGKKNLAKLNEDAKSIEGSFMFFMVAFIMTLVPLLLFSDVGREETLIISTIVGFNVALIEMISHTGNDNLLIPLTTFAFISTHIEMPLENLRINLLILGIIFILVTIANRVKAWSKLALVETLVVGYLTITLYNIHAIIPPLLLFFTVMRFPKQRENEKNNLYDARIIETNVIIGTAICGIVAITGLKKEFFITYVGCYAMHLIINTFVRLKYYFKFSEMKSLSLAIIKGVGFIFIPSLIIQKLVYGEFPQILTVIATFLALVLSGIMICLKKKNVESEEISIDNGYMHTKIVFILTVIVSGIQILQFI